LVSGFGCSWKRKVGDMDILFAGLQQFTRLWAESRRRTPFKRPKLYFIKAHKVTFSRAFSHTPTQTHIHTEKSPQDALAFSQQSLLHTYTHTHLHNGHYPFVAGTAPLCCRHYPCLSIAPGSLDPQAPRRSFLHAGGLCLCDNRIYCFIKFVFKLPLPLSLLAFAPASATACALLLRFLLGVLNVGQMNAKNFGLLALLLDHYFYYYFTG